MECNGPGANLKRVLPNRQAVIIFSHQPLISSRKYTEDQLPRHCLTLDLKDDQAAIAEYKRYHVKIWPEVKQSLFEAGIVDMEIYLLGTRMFMIMDVNNAFSLEAKAAADAVNAKVQEWEAVMHGFQKQLSQSRKDQWWVPMERVFSLAEQ